MPFALQHVVERPAVGELGEHVHHGDVAQAIAPAAAYLQHGWNLGCIAALTMSSGPTRASFATAGWSARMLNSCDAANSNAQEVDVNERTSTSSAESSIVDRIFAGHSELALLIRRRCAATPRTWSRRRSAARSSLPELHIP